MVGEGVKGESVGDQGKMVEDKVLECCDHESLLLPAL